jgi:hypothetical protein
MPTADTSLAANVAAAAGGVDPRDTDPRFIRINGVWFELPPANDDPAQAAPTLTYEHIVALHYGYKTNAASVTWRRFKPGDDDRNPTDYGLLKLTSGPLLRRPGYRFTVARTSEA